MLAETQGCQDRKWNKQRKTHSAEEVVAGVLAARAIGNVAWAGDAVLLQLEASRASVAGVESDALECLEHFGDEKRAPSQVLK